MASGSVPGDNGASTLGSSEFRTLTALVPRVAASTVLVLIVGTAVTGNEITGKFNKPLYLAILGLAVVITAIFLRTHHPARLDIVYAAIATGGIVAGIWGIERPSLLVSDWAGFGYRVALGTLALLVLIGTVVRVRTISRPVLVVLWLIVGIVCACDIIGLIRTVDYLSYQDNNLNIINDMLGPVAGKAPDSAYIPQYTALYGWLFLPFKHLLTPLALVGAMTIFMNALTIGAAAIAIAIVRRFLGRHGWLLATALIVPLTFVTSHLAGDQSSIASLFQELPIRVLSGLIVLAIGLKDLALLYRGSMRAMRLLLIGAVCGLVAWNSQDFGFAAAGVFGLMIVVSATASIRVRALGAWFGGFLIGVASYPLFLFAIGSPLNLNDVAAFVRLFGSGLGSAAIQVPGPVLVVVPVIICSATVGWALMAAPRRRESGPDMLRDQAVITLAFVGTWSAVCLVYYVNRAYAPGQLQTMLLPCGICIAALLSIAMHTDEVAARFAPSLPIRARVAGTATMIPVGIFVCLCFSSALLTPNPILAVKTLLHPPPTTAFTNYDLPQVLSAITAAQRYTSGKPGELTYLGENFNYIALATHVPSSAVLFPYPLPSGTVGVDQIECQYLVAHHSQWVVLSINGVTAFGHNACGVYRTVDAPGLLPGQLQEYK